MSDLCEGLLTRYSRFDAELLGDPYPLLNHLLFHDPIHWSDYLDAWVITRYGDVSPRTADEPGGGRKGSYNRALERAERHQLGGSP